MQDGTLSRIDNIVIKNNMLDRIYCTDICAGHEIKKRKIMAGDIENWVVVNMFEPSTVAGGDKTSSGGVGT